MANTKKKPTQEEIDSNVNDFMSELEENKDKPVVKKEKKAKEPKKQEALNSEVIDSTPVDNVEDNNIHAEDQLADEICEPSCESILADDAESSTEMTKIDDGEVDGFADDVDVVAPQIAPVPPEYRTNYLRGFLGRGHVYNDVFNGKLSPHYVKKTVYEAIYCIYGDGDLCIRRGKTGNRVKVYDVPMSAISNPEFSLDKLVVKAPTGRKNEFGRNEYIVYFKLFMLVNGGILDLMNKEGGIYHE